VAVEMFVMNFHGFLIPVTTLLAIPLLPNGQI